MITIYKHGQIPKSIEIVKLNDVYFNKYTAQMLDNRANEIIERLCILICIVLVICPSLTYIG